MSERSRKLEFLNIVEYEIVRCECFQIEIKTHLLHTVDKQKRELLRKPLYPESSIEKLP